MRKTIAESIAEAGNDELLTTGEAATLLNSSRQHVVDLCNRGDLPFVTVGTHRRVRRSDVDALLQRTLRLTRDQRRSLWLAYAAAGHIVSDPERVKRIARENLESMRLRARGQALVWLNEWDKLLSGPIEVLMETMVSRSPRGRELRQKSPFAGVLGESEREMVLEAWKAYEESRSAK